MSDQPKFRAGQVVMVRSSDGLEYPVKLEKLTRIGDAEEGFKWFDTLSNIEYEKRMRPLTVREKGERPTPHGKEERQ
jgi:hypothetical protein